MVFENSCKKYGVREGGNWGKCWGYKFAQIRIFAQYPEQTIDLSSTLNWSYKTSEGFWVYARFGFNFATTKIAPGSGIFFIRIRKIWIRFCNNRNRARIRYFFIRIRNTGLTWPVNVATVCCSPCRSTGQTRTPWRCSCRPRSRGWWQRRWSCPRSRGSSLHNVRLSYFENLKVY